MLKKPLGRSARPPPPLRSGRVKYFHGSDQCKRSKITNQNHLSERQLAGLQYLGDYIFLNLYQKLRSSKEWKSSQSQHSISLLLAAKVEKVEEANKLISCPDKGGLWAICTPAQNVLLLSETYLSVKPKPTSLLDALTGQK